MHHKAFLSLKKLSSLPRAKNENPFPREERYRNQIDIKCIQQARVTTLCRRKKLASRIKTRRNDLLIDLVNNRRRGTENPTKHSQCATRVRGRRTWGESFVCGRKNVKRALVCCKNRTCGFVSRKDRF